MNPTRKGRRVFNRTEELKSYSSKPREIESTDSEVYMLAERKTRKRNADQIDAIEIDIKDRAAALLNRF